MNTAQRGLRDAVIRGVAEAEGRTPVEMGQGGALLRMSVEEGETMDEDTTAATARLPSPPPWPACA